MRTPSYSRPSLQDEEISPAGTFDTALTSPSTFDDTDRSPAPTKITFEHNIRSHGGGAGAKGAGLLFGMTKPALGIATLLILGGAGAAAFGWFKIPGLTSQIEELEAQVQLLSGQIDRLKAENDRYENLNNQLNQTVLEFQELNEDLNATVTDLQFIADNLNQTQLELLAQVDELTKENQNYARLNNELNTTATRLGQEVDFFETAIAKLVLENVALSNVTAALEEMANELGTLTEAENQTLTEMFSVLNGLRSENERLESLNTNLSAIVSFLNETSLGLDNTLQQVTGFLASQINANQALLTQTLENTYLQRVQNWDCAYRDNFREQGFGANFSQVITNLSGVVDFVDERVLSELCLDKSDFQQYLLQEYPDGVTSFRLLRGVSTYTTVALDYYFPEAGETGIAPEEWADAAYDCQNLPSSFSWPAI